MYSPGIPGVSLPRATPYHGGTPRPLSRPYPCCRMHLPTFDYQPLGRVICGPGTLRRLGEVCRGLGGTRVLLVTDPGLEHAGHPQRAEAYLREAGIEVA